MSSLCKTERLSGLSEDGRGIARAAEILRGGGTVAFPTETVYGLGADALNPEAVAKIFLAKGRPAWDPLIVHVSDLEMLARTGVVSTELNDRVKVLTERFWPGPLTLLLPRTSLIPDAVTAGRALVGVRMPAHRVALELIRLAGVPVAAPSANRFGHTSPTTVSHVLDDLDGRIDGVLDGGPTEVGIESTVLDPTQTPMMIYRPGAVTSAMIAEATGCEAAIFASRTDADAVPESLPSPGVGLRHYAPRARLMLVVPRSADGLTNALIASVRSLKAAGQKVGVMLPTGWDPANADEIFSLGGWGDHRLFAQRLFAGLRHLDLCGVTAIVCPVPEGDQLAAALCDRLEKAARPI